MRDRDPAAREARAMLGVSPDADSAQIVRAYRRRARAVHPDVSTEQDAGAQFSALSAAYQLLLETAHEPGPAPAGDDQGPIVDQDHRQRVAAPGPVGGWPAGWAGRGVAWLVAGPVRVQPPAGPIQQPGLLHESVSARPSPFRRDSPGASADVRCSAQDTDPVDDCGERDHENDGVTLQPVRPGQRKGRRLPEEDSHGNRQGGQDSDRRSSGPRPG